MFNFNHFRYILFFLLSYLFITLLLFLFPINNDYQRKGDIDIFIKTTGFHTDILLPIENEYFDWSQYLDKNKVNSSVTDFKYLSVGWGNRDYYINCKKNGTPCLSALLKSAFGVSKAAININLFRDVHENNKCIKIKIDDTQYLKLIDFVISSFKKNDKGNFISIETSNTYGNNDSFYEAKGFYFLFNTCNTWANNALKKSGLKACIWTPSDKGIFFQYKSLN